MSNESRIYLQSDETRRELARSIDRDYPMPEDLRDELVAWLLGMTHTRLHHLLIEAWIDGAEPEGDFVEPRAEMHVTHRDGRRVWGRPGERPTLEDAAVHRLRGMTIDEAAAVTR